MRARSGAKADERTFGPGGPPDTRWRLVRWHDADHVEIRQGVGPTAFMAVRDVGWGFQETVEAQPLNNTDPDVPTEIVRAVRVPG